MKIKFIKKFLSLFVLSAVLFSCIDDDQTGESQLTPSSPTLSVNLGFTNPTLVEDDTEYTYTVTLSETQIVDVKLHVTQIGGTASADDYEMTTSITIPAGYTSASGSIKILNDELIEDTETLQIQIGDNRVANAAFTAVTTEFTILNYTEGDLVIDMDWALTAIATDDSGEEISATDFADMRLLLTDAPTNQAILDGADGGSFETYVLSGNAPDGDYYLVADFYDANADIVRTLDINLEFNQAGVINGDAHAFPSAITNDFICGANFFVLTKVTKAGTTYTFEDMGINNMLSSHKVWLGTDAGFDSQIETGVDCTGGLTISNVIAGWMLDFWGEEVQVAGDVYYTIDASGVITIANQFLYTTIWNGGVQPDYYIEGTGTLDEANGTLDIAYKLIQDGWDVSGDYGEADGFFHATLTLD
ncbi:MAG: hypothetical protein QM495_03600 [Lutibacter sp.]|uniref:hypothetical protein n=1 Tax=Lutibacter sp. TaxID=1925666 RepID=UPI00385D30B4